MHTDRPNSSIFVYCLCLCLCVYCTYINALIIQSELLHNGWSRANSQRRHERRGRFGRRRHRLTTRDPAVVLTFSRLLGGLVCFTCYTKRELDCMIIFSPSLPPFPPSSLCVVLCVCVRSPFVVGPVTYTLFTLWWVSFVLLIRGNPRNSVVPWEKKKKKKRKEKAFSYIHIRRIMIW